MFLIALVGWVAWSVVRPVSSKIEVGLAEVNSATTIDSFKSASVEPESKVPIDWTGKPLMALLYGVGTALTFYVAFEVIRFQRFQKACAAVKQLGGRVIGKPACDIPFLGYVFSSFVVDLSDSDISDAHCPSFRAIPFLTKVQLSNTAVGRRTVEELSWCPHLEALDLSNTPLERRQIGPLAKLKKLENLLID